MRPNLHDTMLRPILILYTAVWSGYMQALSINAINMHSLSLSERESLLPVLFDNVVICLDSAVLMAADTADLRQFDLVCTIFADVRPDT